MFRPPRATNFVLALTTIRACSAMAHAGASSHWEELWAKDGGLSKGSRFDVAGVSLPLAAEAKKRPLAPRAGMTALVPGCGRAYDAIFLAECGFQSVVALDLSPTACKAANEEIRSSGASSALRARVSVECGDFFELNAGRRFDFIWDCTFLCALEPAVREQWALKTRSLLTDDGELLSCVFPIGPREGGPPFAMSVSLVRSLLQPVGFAASIVRDDLPLEEQHRRPGDAIESVRTRASALVSWRKTAMATTAVEGAATKRRRLGPPTTAMAAPTVQDGASSGAVGPLIIDTDCGLDDLATLALAAAAAAPLRLVTTTSGLAPHGHGHRLARRMLDQLGLSSVPVVAGAEAPPPSTVREKAEWETAYGQRVAEVTAGMGMKTTFADHLAQRECCDSAAAAQAILDTAQAAGGGVTILALGALTNIAKAVKLFPGQLAQYVERIIFIGDTDPSRHSYNAALDPVALQVVVSSGIEMILIGSPCYPSPDWVGTRFGEMGFASRTDQGSKAIGATGEGGTSSAAMALQVLGGLDPYSMCYDPLALMYHLQPDAFECEAPIAVRLTGDMSTAHGWRFERCPSDAPPGLGVLGYVMEPSAVSLERYEGFLRKACSAGK